MTGTVPGTATATDAMTASFRHDPRKSVLVLPGGDGGRSRWWSEPAICGYRRLTHRTAGSGRAVPVPVCASPVVVTGVGVVVGSYDGRVRLFSPALDRVYWECRLESPIYASLVVDQHRRTVIVASTGGTVRCLDLRGRPRWSTQVGMPVYATPAPLPDPDVLVVAGFGGRCVGLRLDDGAVVFDRDLPRPWYAAHGGTAAVRDPYASPVAVGTGEVVVGCAEHLLCLAADGTERWRRDLGRSVRASPCALPALGQVVVCLVDGDCVFLDTETGRVTGAVPIGGKVVASPAVSGEVLAVGTQDGTAFGIDVRRHTVRWRLPGRAPHDHTSVTVAPDGSFVTTVARGNIVSLRPDGGFQWETSQLLGLAEHDPRLDITPVVGPHGSMYCASYSGFLYHFRFRPDPDEE